jgi:hypothetical protein
MVGPRGVGQGGIEELYVLEAVADPLLTMFESSGIIEAGVSSRRLWHGHGQFTGDDSSKQRVLEKRESQAYTPF